MMEDGVDGKAGRRVDAELVLHSLISLYTPTSFSDRQTALA